MGSDFNVSVGEVRAHAQTVQNIASLVRSVSGQAQDSVGGGAFGMIGQFFAMAITQAADELRQGIDRAGQTVEQVQSGLCKVADDYQATDERHMSVFRAVSPELGARA